MEQVSNLLMPFTSFNNFQNYIFHCYKYICNKIDRFSGFRWVFLQNALIYYGHATLTKVFVATCHLSYNVYMFTISNHDEVVIIILTSTDLVLRKLEVV